MSIRRISWKTAILASVAIHAAVVGVVALAGWSRPPTGGDGMITVELGGPAGDAGGFGDVQKDGRLGNGGTGGDGVKTHSAERKANEATETEKPAKKTDGEDSPEPLQVAKAEEAGPEETVPKPEQEKAPEMPVAETGDVKAEAVKPVVAKTEKPAKKEVKREAPRKEKPKPVAKKPVAQPVKGDAKAEKPAPKAVKSEAKGEDGKARKENSGAGGVAGAAGAAGTLTGKSATDGSGVGNGAGEAFGNGRFVANGDGTYTALGSGGIAYKIRHEETPVYPREARSIGFNKVVKLRVKFLVGLNGRVESAEVTTKKVPDLGFKESALAAVRAMEFEPIYYRGHNIKMYFKKTIVFQP